MNHQSDVPPTAGLPPSPPQSEGYRTAYAPVDPSRLVTAPAIALIVVAGLDLLMALLLTVANLLSISVGTGFLRLDDVGSEEIVAQLISGLIGLFLCILGLVISSLIIFGAVRMLQLRSWGFAMTAAILAVIPCISSPCCVLGIPFGIWAIMVLQNPEVKAVFPDRQSSVTSSTLP